MPYDVKKVQSNTLFSAFSSPPKNLDPVLSYNANEWSFISQIYEPPLQYNYLKRPYELEPLTLTEMPKITYLDKEGVEVEEHAADVVYTKYYLHIKENILYRDHPAFVKNEKGALFYADLSSEMLQSIADLKDFKKSATRMLSAEDYAYAIKRMAVRQNHSPILDTMQGYIVGLKAFSKKITEIARAHKKEKRLLDLRPYAIEGVKVIDTSTLTITIKGKYPQFLYWLSMPFFAPIPWEADLFYQQKGLIEKNITFDWCPVGTGAYYMAVHDPHRKIVLRANPKYHDTFYPSLSQEEKKRYQIPEVLLKDAGKKLPFIDEVIFTLEKESIPLWNKFLQGYYDASGVSSDAFDQAIQVSASGNMMLSEMMQEKGIALRSSVQPSIFYTGFNMLDPVIGGYSESAKKLRQAISIAYNQEEYISIFMNERGIPAQGPIPPDIFGYMPGKAGMNPHVYNWVDGKAVRKPLSEAQQLMAEAGYPNGISKKTGKVLKLYYDVTATGPDERAMMDWTRKQFAKLGIQLVIRATDYNRFQDKVRTGKAQLFSWGWYADYPDPENFLMLLYGKNAIVDTEGAGMNMTNYKNTEFDALFDTMNVMESGEARKEVIEKMIKIVRKESPWIWGFHSKSLVLYHQWNENVLPAALAGNALKYKRVNSALRYEKQRAWNQPVLFPLALLALFILLAGWGLYRIYHHRQRAVIKRGRD